MASDLPQFRTYAWKTDPHMTERLGELQRKQSMIEFPNPQDAWDALSNSVQTMKKVSRALLDADYDGNFCEACQRKGPSPESLAKTLSYVAKTVDETTRLLEFAQGRADSRPDTGLADLMKLLTAEQWQTFQSWIQPKDVTEINPLAAQER